MLTAAGVLYFAYTQVQINLLLALESIHLHAFILRMLSLIFIGQQMAESSLILIGLFRANRQLSLLSCRVFCISYANELHTAMAMVSFIS